jgi:hypothetical protein
MGLIATVDKNKLYTHVKHVLGYPMRPFELKDEMMDSYFEMAIEDYSSVVNMWLIQQQWYTMYGLDGANADFLSAFTNKSNTYMESFTYAYSRQVGLGTNAPAASGWELKRDFIITEANTQHYIIPKGREVNEVLWETPPEIDGGLVDPFALNAWSPGYGRLVISWSSSYVCAANIFNITFCTRQKNETKSYAINFNISYNWFSKSGEKVLHLYPIPGSRHEIAGQWGIHYAGRKVWYWYYDTLSTDRDVCLEENSDAMLRLPSDAPTKVLDWTKMNDVAHQQIRNFLIAQVKIVLGGMRGFYTGELGVTDKQLTMDYRHLLEEGTKLLDDTKKELLEQLTYITQD